MIDMDNLEYINDTAGHMIGDKVILEMVNCLKNTMRENDIVGRIGGNKFVIFMKQFNFIEGYEK